MIDPIAFQLGPIAVHWYGLLYGLALVAAYLILVQLNKKQRVFKDSNQILDLLFWLFIVGVVIGGRLGYILFYNLGYYLENPGQILAIWEGGMSFHGGLIGTLIVGMIYCRKHKISVWKAADLIVIPGALAQAIGRWGNLINAELPGRVIENPDWQWLAMNFGDGLARYPSPIFQSFSLVLMFGILLFIFSKKPKPGVLLFSYLMLSGLFRFVTEFWRQPDVHLGFLVANLTMGQLISTIVFGIGVVGLITQGQKR